MDEIGIIYYTDNRIDGIIIETAKRFILASGLPIVSCSLKPVDIGYNIVLDGLERSYPTMVLQILTALEHSEAKYVFFTEHDVLYHRSHFDFIPPTDDLYYYNVNNWRWEYPKDRAISYDELTSLSSLCCNRELAIEHYRLRLRLIEEWGLDKIRSREPRWARKFGYEPGTKLKSRGGVTDEAHVKVKSALPNIDIRHSRTFSQPKVTLGSFRRLPTNWREMPASQIEGWDLKGLFNLWN